MKARIAILLSLAAVLATPALRAQDDAEGCKDSPLIQRMPGSTISTCDHAEFDSIEMPVGKNADGDAITKNIEGEKWAWTMGNRDGLSDVQVFRNFLSALQSAKWTIDYQNPGQITAHKGSDYVFLDNINAGFYYQTIVHLQDMKQEVTADASTMADAINQTGHVAVYGINFDTGKATILPESEKVLGEIDKLLVGNADWKLRVEGHTDNTGTAAANQTLSEKRAQAVVAWLVAHGIDAGRLSAVGFGQTKPIADNGTEDGRAKNRRVELAKQ